MAISDGRFEESLLRLLEELVVGLQRELEAEREVCDIRVYVLTAHPMYPLHAEEAHYTLEGMHCVLTATRSMLIGKKSTV